MIRYKINLLSALKNSGYNTNKIRKDKVFNESQLQQMRDNKLLTQDALNKLCRLLNCQPGDILEYVPDNTDGANTEWYGRCIGAVWWYGIDGIVYWYNVNKKV